MSEGERGELHTHDAPISRWGVGAALVLGAVLMILAGQVVLGLLYPVHVPAKGEVARRTYRAAVDAVFDLHETQVAEARLARATYLPIYDASFQVLGKYREKIVAAVLAEPSKRWAWPIWRPPRVDAGPSDQVAPSGDADGAGARGQENVGHDGGRDRGARSPQPDTEVRRGDGAVRGDDAAHEHDAVGGGDAVPAKDGVGGRSHRLGAATSGHLSWQVRGARRRDLQKLAYGCLKLLEPYYRSGVIADHEFPNEKRWIRWRFAASSRGAVKFRRVQVATLHRFSRLRGVLEEATRQFFYHVTSRVRTQVIDFILQRLPPNLGYASDNRKFVGELSQVTGLKVILIRRGEILVAKGDVVDMRAHHAIRASVEAQKETSRWSRWLGRGAILLALLFFFVFAFKQSIPPNAAYARAVAVIVGGMVLLSWGGQFALRVWPIHSMLLPQAALALVAAALLGRNAALISAVVVASGLAVALYFDLTILMAGGAGGILAALVVRLRRRSAVLPAGILVGIVQALALEATRVASGRPQTYDAAIAAAQAFGGGILAALVASVALPFVQRFLGVASRGQLKTLLDFESPLARRLRERVPQVFTHALRVVSLADRAAKALGKDRMLCRAGALYHDLGKLEMNPLEGPPDDPVVAAELRRDHIRTGLELGRRHGLPREVLAMIAEHHGTLEMSGLWAGSPEPQTPELRRLLRFSGPRPQTVESAIIMIANGVEHARSRWPKGRPPSEDAARCLVEGVIVDQLSQFQFAECRLTQRQLGKIERGLVAFLIEVGEG
ncbi:MAG: HDIG domain-containing protein [Deltaproteobacteria bacterium]|nr:HDIG domain-containing protein [Deltaproteobacteria bacterium]